MKAPIILAVDTQDLETAKQWIAATSDSVSIYKLGLEFFLTHGAAGYRAVVENSDSEIFLDLKLHDIPNTVKQAVSSVKDLNPRFLTVHAAGGSQMIAAAAQEAPHIDITAVTVLTSLSEDDLFDIGFANPALESAVALARLSVNAGARAIVSSPLEISAIRSAIGDKAKIITPGVRPAGVMGNDDQSRTMTPVEAISAGADFVVIGRPISSHWKSGAAAMTSAARSIADDILQHS